MLSEVYVLMVDGRPEAVFDTPMLAYDYSESMRSPYFKQSHYFEIVPVTLWHEAV